MNPSVTEAGKSTEGSAGFAENALRRAVENKKGTGIFYVCGTNAAAVDRIVRWARDNSLEREEKDLDLIEGDAAETYPSMMSHYFTEMPILAQRKVVVLRNIDKMSPQAASIFRAYMDSWMLDKLLIILAGSPGSGPDAFIAGFDRIMVLERE